MGNYFLETDLRCYATQESHFESEEWFDVLHCTLTNDNDCIILNVSSTISSNIVVDINI